MSVVLSLLGGISGQVWAYLAMVLGGIAVLFMTRLSGRQAQQVSDLRREADDRHEADAIASDAARMSGATARADLSAEFGRKP